MPEPEEKPKKPPKEKKPKEIKPRKGAEPLAPPAPALRSELYGRHPQELSLIRESLVAFYGKEHRGKDKKLVAALEGAALEAAVTKQMHFLHPGLGDVLKEEVA